MKIPKTFYVIFFVILLFGAAVFFFSTKENKETSMLGTSAPVAKTNEEILESVLAYGALADVATAYGEALLYTNALLNADSQKVSEGEWLVFLQKAIQKWQNAEASAWRFNAVVEILPDYKISTAASNERFVFGVTPTFAQDKIPLEELMSPPSNDKKPVFDPLRGETSGEGEVSITAQETWHTILYKAPPKSRLEIAKKIFNTEDAKEANNKLQELNAAVTNKELFWADAKAKAVIGTVLVSNIAVFVSGLGAAELAVVGTAGQWVNLANIFTTSVSGANLALDIGENVASLGLASKETSAAFAKAKDQKILKGISTLISIKDLVKTFSGGNKVLDKIVNEEGKITRDSILQLTKDKKFMEQIKEDAMGNIQTTYDWYDKANKFFKENPGVSAIKLAPAEKRMSIKQGAAAMKLNSDGFLMDRVAAGQLQNLAGVIDISKETVRIVRACSSGQFIRYTDCYSGRAVSRGMLAPGKHRFAIAPNGRSARVLITGGKGTYRVFVTLSNGEVLDVAEYPANSKEVILNEAAKGMGWRSSGVTIYAPLK